LNIPEGTKVTIQVLELPVSASGVKSIMDPLHASLLSTHPPSTTVIYLHLGVDGTQKIGKFKLERRGYNDMNFRVPDNDGYQPMGEVITQTLKRDEWMSSVYPVVNGPCPFLDSVAFVLKGKYGHDSVVTSDDAGRFVCNYTLYTTLARIMGTGTKKTNGNLRGGGGGG